MSLTPTEREALITSRNLEVQAGLELLDTDDELVEDISDELVGGSVEHNNFLDVHGSFRLDITEALTWVEARLRVYQVLTAGDLTDKFYLGVCVPTTPQTVLGKTPGTFSVSGMDKLSLLTDNVGDTYVVQPGVGYLAAVRAIIAARVGGLTPHFEGTKESSVLADPMVWLLDMSSQYTWLGICNALLKKIAYNPLWCDGYGRFRSEPYVKPTKKTPLCTLDVSDELTDIVLPERTLSEEYGADASPSVNYWRFVKADLTAAPSEGTTMYTVDESGSAIKRKKVQTLDVADYDALVKQGDKIRQEDKQVTRTLTLSTGPRPDLGHLDVIRYKGDTTTGTVNGQVQSWSQGLRPSHDGKVAITLELLS